MARRKRGSEALTKAKERSENLASIDSELDLGNGMTLSAYNERIQELTTQLDAYNLELSQLDAKLGEIVDAETGLDDLSEQMLQAVAAKFGKRSIQYKKAGGVRKDERKHRNSNKKANGNSAAT